MKNEVVDKNLGFIELMAAFEDLDGDAYVEVGVPAANGSFQYQAEGGVGGAPLILVATVNEFGSDDGRIPERSYLRSTMDDEQAHFGNLLERLSGLVLDGKKTVEDALDIVGLDAVAKVQRKINDLKEPPNADATIKKKGSSNPLVDTGQLKQSIMHQVKR